MNPHDYQPDVYQFHEKSLKGGPELSEADSPRSAKGSAESKPVPIRLFPRTTKILEKACHYTGWTMDEVIYEFVCYGLRAMEASDIKEARYGDPYFDPIAEIELGLKAIIELTSELVYEERSYQRALTEIHNGLVMSRALDATEPIIKVVNQLRADHALKASQPSTPKVPHP